MSQGLERAKVEDITRAAGLSKGAFYLHFQSKEHAFEAVVSEALAKLEEKVTNALAETRVHYAEGLDALVKHWLERDVETFEVIWQHRAIMRLVLLEGGGSASYLHLTRALVERMRAEVAGVLRLGVELGFYRSDIDPQLAATFACGGFDQAAHMALRAKKKANFRSVLMEYHRYCARAFGTPELVAAVERLHEEEKAARA